MIPETAPTPVDQRHKKVTVVTVFFLLALFLGIVTAVIALSGPGGGGGKGGVGSGSGSGGQSGDGNGDGIGDGPADGSVTASVSDVAADSAATSSEPDQNPDPFVPTNTYKLVDDRVPNPPASAAPSGGGRDAGSGGGRGGGRGTGNGSAVGNTTFMGAKAEGRSFIYIVDCSGSMQGSKLQEAKDELSKSIDKLGRQQQFFVFFYDDQSYPMPRASGDNQMAWATRAEREALKNWASSMHGGGGTRPAESLLAAIRMRPEVIFLMSDGQFEMAVCDQVRQAQGTPPVTIHTIGFIDRSGEPVLQRLAEENGGTYTFNPGNRGGKP